MKNKLNPFYQNTSFEKGPQSHNNRNKPYNHRSGRNGGRNSQEDHQVIDPAGNYTFSKSEAGTADLLTLTGLANPNWASFWQCQARGKLVYPHLSLNEVIRRGGHPALIVGFWMKLWETSIFGEALRRFQKGHTLYEDMAKSAAYRSGYEWNGIFGPDDLDDLPADFDFQSLADLTAGLSFNIPGREDLFFQINRYGSSFEIKFWVY